MWLLFPQHLPQVGSVGRKALEAPCVFLEQPWSQDEAESPRARPGPCLPGWEHCQVPEASCLRDMDRPRAVGLLWGPQAGTLGVGLGNWQGLPGAMTGI